MDSELQDWDLEAGQGVTFALMSSSTGGSSSAPSIHYAVSDDGEHLTAEVPRESLVDAGNGDPEPLINDLLEAGWVRKAAPSDTALTIVKSRSGVDLLAHLGVGVLRDTFGIPHPTFLQGGFLSSNAAEEPGAADQEVEAIDPMTTYVPESPLELDQIVEKILSSLLGRPVWQDEDGDYPMRYGSVVVFVRPRAEEPIVELLSPVVRDVENRDQALLELSILNRRAAFISYHLEGTTIVARVHLPAFPLVANHLIELLSTMSQTLDRADEDLALRVGGRLWLDLTDSAPPIRMPISDDGDDVTASEEGPSSPSEIAGKNVGAALGAPRAHAKPNNHDPHLDEVSNESEDHSKDLPAPLLAMLQLDAEGDLSVEPEVIAALFEGSIELVVQCLRLTEQETICWRESMEDAMALGDSDEADVCANEMRAWERSVSDLRAGLRFIVKDRTRERWQP